MHRVGPDLAPQVVARRESFPLCFDLLPGSGALLLISNGDRAVLRVEAGAPAHHADLSGLGEHPWNDVVVAADGSAYVNNIGFDFGGAADPADAGAVGFVVLVRPDGAVDVVADGLAFPNGMALVDGGTTLLVAESYGQCLTAFPVGGDGTLTDRRVWAATPGLHPDGIHAAGDGTVWLADVGTRCCVRVAAGGAQLDRVELDRSAFDCAVGDLTGTGSTLYVAVNDFGGSGAAGQIRAVPIS